MADSNEPIIITLPLPPKALSPNARDGTRWHRIQRQRAKKAYRERAHCEALAVRPATAFSRARATLTFYWPNRLRRDVRNAEHSMKPAYDGIVDAGIIPDDRAGILEHGPTTFDVDKSNPRVELMIQPLTDAA